jgi:glycine oxidase
MLVDFPDETAPALRALAKASARMYPEFVHELEDESRLKIDLRSVGTLLFVKDALEDDVLEGSGCVADWREMEPSLSAENLRAEKLTGVYLKEGCVDPRQLTAAAIGAAKHRNIDFSSGNPVTEITTRNSKVTGVRTAKTEFSSGTVVNCAGAWSGQIHRDAARIVPTRPVKGQMLCVIMPEKALIRHVVRTPEVYLIPRSDGRMLIGATQEEAGFDKRTVPETIEKLRRAAIDAAPRVAEARILEAWAGLRPGTPDGLPILGATELPGYLVATGHFRDGILLAPVTAKVMGQMISGEKPSFDLTAFSPDRF